MALFHKSLNQILAQHIKELDEFGLVPTDWVWHKDKVKSLEKIDEQLIDDLINLHKQHKDVPEMFENAIHILKTLHNDLEAMLKQGASSAEKQEAEIVNNLIAQVKELLKSRILESGEKEERLKQLQQWGFDVGKYPDLAEFLITHWDGTNEIVKAAGESAYQLFWRGLPIVQEAGILNEKTWPMIVQQLLEIAKAGGDEECYVWEDGLPALLEAGIINEKTWPGLVEMAKATGKQTWKLFTFHLPALQRAGFINEKTWPELVEMVTKVTDDNFYYFLEGIIKAGILNEKTWPMIVKGFVEMTKTAGEDTYCLFRYGLLAVQKAGIINEKTWPMIVQGLVEMAKAAGEESYLLFQYGLPAVQRAGIINEKTWPMIVKGLVEMAKAAGKNAPYLFKYGLPVVRDIINEKTLPIITKRFVEICKYCKGTEKQTFTSFKNFKPLFTHFGIELFDELIMPTLKTQTVGAFLCFTSFGKIDADALQTKDDLELLRFIVEKKSTRANDILVHIILAGIEQGVIEKPLSKEADIIKEFLRSAPAYLIELYIEFRNIYKGNLDGKHLHYENLFRDIRQLKKDIVNGILTRDYNENLVIGVLYSVFSPEVTIERSQYKQILDNRQDRQQDIPSALDRISGKRVRLSKGSHVLKGSLDTSSWNNLVEAVNEINRNRIDINSAQLGINLITEYRKGTLRKKQKEYLRYIYSFDVNNGNSLPDFNANHETLMKYKEFIGDRLKNDLIFSLLSKAQQEYPQQFNELLGSSKADYRRLAKTLFGLWRSKAAGKEKKIKLILEKNGLYADKIEWKMNITADEINSWLNSLSANVIEKSAIQKIFNELYGEKYKVMQKEIEKFEFKREGKSMFGKPFRFVLSKRKLHSCAMFNMGVCIAPDDKLWNSEDMWQMLIFDEEDNACGGVIYRTINENGKYYLTASIQPSTSILSSVSPQHLYAKIIQFSMLMVKILKYQNLLISTNSIIHSNRGSIQSAISSMNYPEIKLKHNYDFSYSPYHYKYREFYIAN